MSCKAAIGNVRTELSKAISEMVAEGAETHPDGSSSAFTIAWYKKLLGDSANPEALSKALNLRVEELSKPFHKQLQRQTGDVLLVEKDGRAETYFLHSSRVSETNTGQPQLSITVAPESNIAQRETLVFDMDSDTSLDMGNGVRAEIYGIREMFERAAQALLSEQQSTAVKEVAIEAEGYAPLQATLEAMDHANKMLNTRQSRLGVMSIVGYEHIRDYKHGDLASMKEMLNKLNVLSAVKSTPAEMEYLNSLFDSFHPSFFNDLQLYLKKNSAQNIGQIDLTNKRLRIEVGTNPSEHMSGAEVYAHEVIHSITAWALRQPYKSITKYRTQLNHALDVAIKNTTWEDLVTVPMDQATELDLERAKEQYEYIFEFKDASEEFLVHTLTNPHIRKHMQGIKLVEEKKETNLLNRVINLFQKIVNVAVGNFTFKDNDISVFDKVNELAFALAEINDSFKYELERSNPLGVVADQLANAESFLSRQLHKIKEKISNKDETVKVPGDGAGILQNALFLLDFTRKALTNPVYRGFAGLLLSTYQIKTNSVIREFARGFFDRTPQFRDAEKLNLLSTEMDASRNSTINAAAAELRNNFKEKLEIEESEVLTTGLVQTNASALFYDNPNRKKYENKALHELFANRFARQKQIRRFEKMIVKELGEGTRARWTINQAKELGLFMTTGQGSVALNLNPTNIAKGFGTNERYTPTKTLVAAIEDLATLTALDATKQKDLTKIGQIFKKETKGVKALTDAMMAYRANTLEHVFGGDPTHMILGHTKELYDSTIDMKIAPLSDARRLQEEGYEVHHTLKNAHGISYRTPMAVYVTQSWGKAERLKGAVSLGVNKAKGTTLRQLKSAEYGDAPKMATAAFGRDFARVVAQSYALNEAMEHEGFDHKDNNVGLSPVYSKTGQITDFRFMMPKADKKEMLRQDLDVFEVVSRTVGDVMYQVQQKELNKDALTLIKNDMLESWEAGPLGKDQYTEFLQIGPDVMSERGKELFYLMPEDIRDFILSRTDKQIAVREEIVQVLFGYQHLQMSNFVGVKMLPKALRGFIDIVEGMWMEFVKIAKGAILLKMPIVLIQNLMSNILYAINTGSIDPMELLRDYRDSFREVNDYIKTNTRISELEAKIAMGDAAGSRVRGKDSLESKMGHMQSELNMLRSRLEENPLHPLFAAGLYQSYIQDIGANTLTESNRLTKELEERTEKVPKAVKYVAEVAYFSQNTQWYKISQEILQRSDMISRAADMKRERRAAELQIHGKRDLPKWWVQQQKEAGNVGYPVRKKLTPREEAEFREKLEEVLFQTVKDNYINYTLPNTAFEEWANRVGILMFTKYLKRVQPIIRDTMINHPIKTALMLLVGNTVATGMSSIQDSNLLFRSFDYSGDFNPFGAVPVYNPFNTIGMVLSPPIIKSDTYLNLLW